MKPLDITVLVGGQAGQGIQTVGHLLSQVCHKAGLFVVAVNDFESRIRGGHSSFQLRISNQPVHAPRRNIHLLLTMDEQSAALHYEHLVPQGCEVTARQGVGTNQDVIHVPFEALAKKAGGRIMANTVAAGTTLALLGAPFDLFDAVLGERFGGAGDGVLENNRKAGQLGFEAVERVQCHWSFDWPTDSTPKGQLIDGNRAVALGALAGDCRFGAFYPMSPATGIMTQLVAMSDKVPLVVEQAEDEIAAINMIIGASFAGARAITATSGGGFCLMTEGVGLAAMTETPIVVVNAQRPGPATGLPTRTAQADLLFTLFASQDEFPRFVFAPSTPHDAYVLTARAFDLADKYQVPAIILVDQFFNDSLFIETAPFEIPEKVNHHIVSDDQMADSERYRRFKITSNGISPRALPCAGHALVMVCSDEHDEAGHMTEAVDKRIAMVDKRNAKWPAMLAEMQPPSADHEQSDIVLVGWGSTRGAIEEAAGLLRGKGISVGSVHFTDLWPFPADDIIPVLEKAGRFFTVEQNRTAQLGQLIRQQTGLASAGAVLKYDGRPFYPREILAQIESQLR